MSPSRECLLREVRDGSRFAVLSVGFSILVSLFWGLGALTERALPPERNALDGSLTRSGSEVVANNGTLRGVFRVVTELGGGTVTIPLAVGVGLIWWLTRRRWDGARLLALSIGGSTGAEALVKWLVSRPRPPVVRLVEATGTSFPSGHAARAAALFGALAVLAAAISRSRRAKVVLWLAASALVAAIAASRVFLGVHYVTDVTAGVALGSAWLALVVAVGWPGSIHALDIGASAVERRGCGSGHEPVGERGRTEELT